MVRVVRVLEVFKVAGDARSLGQVVIVAYVAIDARSRGNAMAARQRESGQRVVELGVQPVIRRVTGLTSDGELAGDVVRILRTPKFLLMAAVASRRHRLEIAERAVLVAVLARCCGMRTS